MVLQVTCSEGSSLVSADREYARLLNLGYSHFFEDGFESYVLSYSDGQWVLGRNNFFTFGPVYEYVVECRSCGKSHLCAVLVCASTCNGTICSGSGNGVSQLLEVSNKSAVCEHFESIFSVSRNYFFTFCPVNELITLSRSSGESNFCAMFVCTSTFYGTVCSGSGYGISQLLEVSNESAVSEHFESIFSVSRNYFFTFCPVNELVTFSSNSLNGDLVCLLKFATTSYSTSLSRISRNGDSVVNYRSRNDSISTSLCCFGSCIVKYDFTNYLNIITNFHGFISSSNRLCTICFEYLSTIFSICHPERNIVITRIISICNIGYITTDNIFVSRFCSST